MATVSHTIDLSGERELIIYGETANLNYFLANDVDPDDTGDVEYATISYGGYSRERYPGDPNPVSVGSGNRRIMIDKGSRNGSGLPGRSFVLSEPAEDGAGERRQFTFKGSIRDLRQWLEENAIPGVVLHSSRGKAYRIGAATLAVAAVMAAAA